MVKPIYDYDENEPVVDKLRDKPTLEDTMRVMQTVEGEVFPATVYYGLSGLDAAGIDRLDNVWTALPAESRRKLLLQLAEASELNFELDYRELGHFALNDEDPGVREAAIELLWEDESPELLSRLIELAQWDDSAEVRATAVSTLGHFILLGEYEEISETAAARAQDAAISLWTNTDEDIRVRRRALEAISNSSHEIVAEAIQEAYESGDHLLQVSSIFAMGRSFDKQWNEIVIRELGSDDSEIRYEAARAAGELIIKEAVVGLGRLAVEDEREIKEEAIWSLGEIGGKEALRILSALAEDAEEADDDDLLEAIEDSISNASMAGEFLDVDEDDD